MRATVPQVMLIPTQDFFNSYSPAYCETWEGVQTYFKETPLEHRRVKELMADIAMNGNFSPIRVYWNEDTNTHSIADGMHRSVAHKWLGATTIPVSSVSNDNHDLGEWLLEVKILVDASDMELAFDEISSLASFRVNDTTWANGESLSSVNNVISVGFANSVEELSSQETFVRDKLLGRLLTFASFDFTYYGMQWDHCGDWDKESSLIASAISI